MTALEAYAAARMAGVPAYRAGADSASPTGKLSSNESPFGPSPAIRAAIAASIDAVNRYDNGRAVRDALAANLGLPGERLILTNGSDELCFLISTVFLARRDAVVVLSEPSYAIDVTVSVIAGAEVRRVPLVDGAHDLAALAAASEGAQLLWLPVPHNPTGRAVDPAELLELLAAVPDDCLVVLDEAYRGFVDEDALLDSIALLEAHPNLLVQRTLSKDHGLAGLRVGYGLGSAPLVAALEAARGPFTVNAAGLAAARATLDSEPWRRMAVSLVRRERDHLHTLLDELGIEHVRSQANFVTVRIPWPAVRDALGRHGLSVRAGEDLGLPGWCRISMGLPAPMARLRQVVREYARERDAR